MKNTIRYFLIMILSIVLVISVTGCSFGSNSDADSAANGQQGNVEEPSGNSEIEAGNGDDVDDKQQTEEEELIEGDKVQHQVLTDSYPVEINNYLEKNKVAETQQAFNINNRTYLVLTMGEQSSGGYAIKLKDLILKDGALNVFVEYEKPGEIATTVMTYPSLVIETDGIYEGHYEIIYHIQR
ncbi:MAG: protease complex subunit PrcB family protein [Peptococcaceae bacterium]|nr:protease complex subunit PrcB family protein [Peptococcaceae bacterium]